MADDLDAFFDEVSTVEAQAKQEVQPDTDVQPQVAVDDDDVSSRPVKKQKPNIVIPRGVVVAAASTVRTTDSTEELAAGSHSAAKSSQFDNIPSTAAPTSAPLKRAIPPPPPSSHPPTTSKKDPSANINHDATKNIATTGNFTIFVGNLAAEVTEADLYEHFATPYPSVHQVQIVRNADGESKGFGFVSFTQALECARAKREMDQSWLGARPIRVKKFHGQQQQATAVGGGKQKHARKKNKR